MRAHVHTRTHTHTHTRTHTHAHTHAHACLREETFEPMLRTGPIIDKGLVGISSTRPEVYASNWSVNSSKVVGFPLSEGWRVPCEVLSDAALAEADDEGSWGFLSCSWAGNLLSRGRPLGGLATTFPS